jgi:hypothetical protein
VVGEKLSKPLSKKLSKSLSMDGALPSPDIPK